MQLFYRFYTIHSIYLRFIFSNKYPYRLIVAIFIGLMYGILLPAWNTFMAGQIDPAEQEETWGVFNSVQGFGSMIGPLFGGLIAQFSNGLNNTFYFSAAIFLVLAIFYGVYFVKYRGKANRF